MYRSIEVDKLAAPILKDAAKHARRTEFWGGDSQAANLVIIAAYLSEGDILGAARVRDHIKKQHGKARSSFAGTLEERLLDIFAYALYATPLLLVIYGVYLAFTASQ